MEPDDESTASSTSTSSSAASQLPHGLNGLNGIGDDYQPHYYYFANNVSTLSRRPSGPPPPPPPKKTNGEVYNVPKQRRPLGPDTRFVYEDRSENGIRGSDELRRRSGKAISHLINPGLGNSDCEPSPSAFNDIDFRPRNGGYDTLSGAVGSNPSQHRRHPEVSFKGTFPIFVQFCLFSLDGCFLFLLDEGFDML